MGQYNSNVFDFKCGIILNDPHLSLMKYNKQPLRLLNDGTDDNLNWSIIQVQGNDIAKLSHH
jgi:hypothetical protein